MNRYVNRCEQQANHDGKYHDGLIVSILRSFLERCMLLFLSAAGLIVSVLRSCLVLIVSILRSFLERCMPLCLKFHVLLMLRAQGVHALLVLRAQGGYHFLRFRSCCLCSRSTCPLSRICSWVS